MAAKKKQARESISVGLYNGERAEMENAWRLVRVLLGGTDAIRRAGHEFTPPTAREEKEPTLYTKRMRLSTLLPAFKDATTDIASRPFQKPPVVSGDFGPSMLARIEEDADRLGNSLSVFAAQHYDDAAKFGMGLFLVDNVSAMKPDGTMMNAREAEEADARPYFVRIVPDNLVGFRFEERFGRNVCTELRVREWVYKRVDTSFQDVLVERIKHYTTEEFTVWERSLGKTTINSDPLATTGRGDSTTFVMVGKPVPTNFPDDEIPLVVTYTEQIGFLNARPPLLELAHLNVNHWNKTSVHDIGVRYSMNPTLFGKGLTAEESEQKPKLGEGSVLLSRSDDAEMRYVEITGSSFAASMERIKQVEDQMRRLAADPLLSGSATATGEVRGEMRQQSLAQHWVEKTEWSLYRGYQIAAAWLGEELPEDFNVSLYRESSMMLVANPARTVALQNDVQNGRMTLLTYWKERKRSGDFADDFDPEAEANAIEEQKAASDEARMQAMAAQIEAERAARGAVGEQPSEPQQTDPAQDEPEKVPA